MIPCVVSDYHRYLTQNGAHHASHIAQLRNLCIWLKMPPPPKHAQCVFWVWGGGAGETVMSSHQHTKTSFVFQTNNLTLCASTQRASSELQL